MIVGGGKVVTEVEENPAVTTTGRVTRATRRLGELKTAGVQLPELLGGEAGAAFIRDECAGDPEVAYEALTLVFSPTATSAGRGRRELSSYNQKELCPTENPKFVPSFLSGNHMDGDSP